MKNKWGQKAIFIFLLNFYLTGCDESAILLNDLFSDRDDVVILEPAKFSKTSGEYIFDEDVSPIIREESNSLCFVLGENHKSKSGDLDYVKTLIDSVGLKGKVILTNGTSYFLNRASAVWSLKGKVLNRREFSACLSLKCKMNIKSGQKIKKIKFSSKLPFEAKGLYWIGSNPLVPNKN